MATENDNVVELTSAQKRHVERLVEALKGARAEVERTTLLQTAAKEKEAAIQVQANGFIAYCGEELGAGDDLVFSQEEMRFVPRPPAEAQKKEQG